MEFTLTEEQRLLKQGIAEWCRKTMPEEKIQEWYRNRGIDPAVAKSWVDSGYGMLGIPEEYGGTPCDKLTLCLAIEELCHAGGNIPMAPNALLNFNILEFGNKEQIADAMEYYRRVGTPKQSHAISEPNAGSDNRNMTTTTTEDSSGRIHLNGTKTWCTNGEWFPGFIVAAKEEDPSRDNKIMSLWVVDKDTPGISVEKLNKIGMQIAPFSMVHFDDVVIDKSQALGERGKGFYNLMKNFEFERCVLIAELLGGRLIKDAYVDYLLRLRVVYAALESAVSAHRDDPLVAAVYDPALERLPALEADLRQWTNGDLRDIDSSASEEYRSRLESVRGGPLLAHHYTRYLGDLSGGRGIGKVLDRSFDLGGRGLAFYEFPMRPKPYKDDYRARLDALCPDLDATDRIVEEVKVAFGLNHALLDELAA